MNKTKRQLLQSRVEVFISGYLSSIGVEASLDDNFTKGNIDNFDSLDFIDLSLAIEQEFSFELGNASLDETTLSNCSTLNQLISIVLNYAEKAGTI